MPEIKEGQRVVPNVQTKDSTPTMEQLQRRTSLSKEELCSGHIKVKVLHDKGQATMSHPKLKQPFMCHTKFFEQAPQA